MNDKLRVDSGTIARTIILFLALLNQVLGLFGVQAIPIEDEQVNLLISTGWTVAAAIAAWWKNNSFTQAAIKADIQRKNNNSAVQAAGED